MTDWFTVQQAKIGLEADWPVWKEAMLSTFRDTSYSSICYAINFNYIGGSMLEYCVKKEKVLIEAQRGFTGLLIVDMIIAGLPEKVQKSLNPSSIDSIEKLHSKIKKFETNEKNNYFKSPSQSLVSNTFQNKGKDEGKSNFGNFRNRSNPNRLKPCSICTKLGSPNRYHRERDCWNKDLDKVKKETNNTEMPNTPLPDEEEKN